MPTLKVFVWSVNHLPTTYWPVQLFTIAVLGCLTLWLTADQRCFIQVCQNYFKYKDHKGGEAVCVWRGLHFWTTYSIRCFPQMSFDLLYELSHSRWWNSHEIMTLAKFLVQISKACPRIPVAYECFTRYAVPEISTCKVSWFSLQFVVCCLFQLEDDIMASPSFASTIRTFALQQESNTWLMLEFSSLGFIGMCVCVDSWPLTKRPQHICMYVLTNVFQGNFNDFTNY